MVLSLLNYNNFIGPKPEKGHAATHLFSEGTFSELPGKWIVKIADDHMIARHEVLAQELFRLFIPHQQQTRIAQDETTYFVCSEKIESYRDLPYDGSRFERGDITGLGQAMLVAVFLEEMDLKNGNIGIDGQNRVVKIDGDQSLASLLNYNLKFNLTSETIAKLPAKSTFSASNWLSFLPKTLSINEQYRSEINQAMLRVLALSDDYIDKFVEFYIPEDNEISRKSYAELIKTRRDNLKIAALENSSFRQYIFTPAAQKDFNEFLHHIKSFSIGGESVVPEYSSQTELNDNTSLKDLQAAATLPILNTLNEQLELINSGTIQPVIDLAPLADEVNTILADATKIKNTLDQELKELQNNQKNQLDSVYKLYIQLKTQELLPLETQSDNVKEYKEFLKTKINPLLEEYVAILQGSGYQASYMLDKFPDDEEWARFDFPEAKRAKESLNIIKLMIGNRSGIESALSATDYSIRMAKQYDLPSASEEFLLLSKDRFVKGIMDANLRENILKLSKHASERFSTHAPFITPNWRIIQSEQVTVRKLLSDISKHVAALENVPSILSDSTEYLSILEQSLQNLRNLKEKLKEQNDLHKEIDPSVLNEIESRLQKIVEGIKQDELISSQKPSPSEASKPTDAPTPGNSSNSVSIPNNFKIRNNVIRVPEDDRKENITAVCNILNNDDLMKGLDGTVPILIQEIRDLANAIDYSDEENISHTLLTIKIKIRDADQFKSTEQVNEVIDSFSHPNHLSFKEIRQNLEKNAVFKEQIESTNAGSLSRP